MPLRCSLRLHAWDYTWGEPFPTRRCRRCEKRQIGWYAGGRHQFTDGYFADGRED